MVHWCSTPFSGPRSPRPPPLPSLPFNYSRPHQEGDASKLWLALVQIQTILDLASCPISPNLEQIGTGECEPRGPSELESRAVIVSGDRGRWGRCGADSSESPRGAG